MKLVKRLAHTQLLRLKQFRLWAPRVGAFSFRFSYVFDVLVDKLMMYYDVEKMFSSKPAVVLLSAEALSLQAWKLTFVCLIYLLCPAQVLRDKLNNCPATMKLAAFCRLKWHCSLLRSVVTRAILSSDQACMFITWINPSYPRSCCPIWDGWSANILKTDLTAKTFFFFFFLLLHNLAVLKKKYLYFSPFGQTISRLQKSF